MIGTGTRAVIYSRYSSENQSAVSIEDQVRLCREHLTREGWHLEQVYRDAALSGATTLRPGYQALLEGARESAFDIVLAESLDRLSRDQEDVAALFKRLRFAGIRLITLTEGEITELHVGLKGTMNALFLKDLADKTRRGLRGRVENGSSAGGRAYGYKPVHRLNATGTPARGELRIDGMEAQIVRRIFERFVGGESPIAIARALNRAGTPGPFGQAWRDTTIRGHALRGTGILRNSLYAGKRVWNRIRFIKDPTTGKRVSRLNPIEAWIVRDVPELRIIDQEVWDRAHERLAGIRARFGADNPDRNRFWEGRRAQHLLSGKIFCGNCGGTVSNIGRDYLGCTAARRQGNCGNRVSVVRRPHGDAAAVMIHFGHDTRE